MAEGDFPKSSGDILYASEVNSFHSRNDIAGIVGTVSGDWTTNPGDLANATDEDATTVTSGGEINTASFDQVGNITFDLGDNISRNSVHIKYQVQFDFAHHTNEARVLTSPDGVTYTQISSLLTENTTNTTFTGAALVPVANNPFRYLRISLVKARIATTSSLIVYEVNVF